MEDEIGCGTDLVDTVKEEADSRDMVKHVENSSQLLVEKTMQVDERELQVMKRECCAEVER